MRALPVPQDVIDLLVTAILISSTDIAPPTASPSILAADASPKGVLSDVDRLGQQLWDANYASVAFANRCSVLAPRYEWRPVAELLGHHVEVEKVLQIERSRLYLQEVSCHHAEWDDSDARRHLQRLEDSIAARLVFHPLEASPRAGGVIEYLGLSCAVDEWTREVGFRAPLTVGSLTKTLEAGDR